VSIVVQIPARVRLAASARRAASEPAPQRPAAFGVPAGAVMGDPLSVPEDPGLGADIGGDVGAGLAAAPLFGFPPVADAGYDEGGIAWFELPIDFVTYAKLGIVHTNDTCPCVILRVTEQEDIQAELIGPPEQMLDLAGAIVRLCKIIPCVASHMTNGARGDAAYRAAG
jgi:hypothetical protein